MVLCALLLLLWPALCCGGSHGGDVSAVVPPPGVDVGAVSSSTSSSIPSTRRLEAAINNATSSGSSSAMIPRILQPQHIQYITATASAKDLSGSFAVHYMGESSDLISVDATAAQMKTALEGMATIDAVDVTARRLVHSTVPPLSLPGMEWAVAFPWESSSVAAPLKPPSMLVDTGIALPSLAATGGTLSGSSAMVAVTRWQENAEVAAAVGFDDDDDDDEERQQTPLAPTRVSVHAVSDTELGVSWRAPPVRHTTSSGNSDGLVADEPDEDAIVTHYSVQWDTDMSFGHEGIIVPARSDDDSYSYTIANLDPSTSYYVRVLAYNAHGYGDVGDAVSLNSFRKVQELTLLADSDGAADLTEAFALSQRGPESGSTPSLSVLSTAKDVEDALNALDGVGLFSVSREDHSTVFDNTGEGTAPFKMIYRITFVGHAGDDDDDGGDDVSLVVDSTNLGDGIVATVEDARVGVSSPTSVNQMIVRPFATHPSGPANVQLSVVSRSELGVSWDPPLNDGGAEVLKYLVEWDESYRFDNSRVSTTNSYSNVVDGPLVRSQVLSSASLSYQIKGLEEGTKYYVRVSAYNSEGYSDAISAAPASAVPIKMPLHVATSVDLAVSASEVPDRLDLQWSLPTHDEQGFVTELDSCGTYTGHASDAAFLYRIRWDTHPSMSSPMEYDARMITGDGSPTLCCPGDKCSLEIGAEVQTITVEPAAEGRSITAGRFKVVYVGLQSRPITVKQPTPGSTLVEIISQSATPSIAAGDFIRFGDGDGGGGGGGDIGKDDRLYQVESVGQIHLTLSSEYRGMAGVGISSAGDESAVVQASYNTPPNSCFDLVNDNSAEDMRTHIGLNFDDSPFNEDIVVSRSSGGDGGGDSSWSYHVTFAGPAFSHHVDELFVVSSLDPWLDASCGGASDSDGSFEVDGIPSSDVLIGVTTEMNAGSVVPGTSYYVDIAPINSAGVGPFVIASPAVEIPRSSPGLAQDCRVYAVPDSSTSLKVDWNGVQPYHGEDPAEYKVAFYDKSTGLVAAISTVAEIDESNTYTLLQEEGLVSGQKYEVVITPINSQGEGGPSWFAEVDSSDASLTTGLYQDYAQRSCFAVPTCELSSEECTEVDDAGLAIRARSTPEPPQVTVATYPSTSDGPNRFTKDSLLVSYEPSSSDASGGSGDDIDKYRIEWSTSSFSFGDNGGGGGGDGGGNDDDQDVTQSHVTSDPEYLIQGLTMGKEYHVRVTAHNSGGYGEPSTALPVKPMTSPDPPHSPTLSMLSINYHDFVDVGTSLVVDWDAPRTDTENGRPDEVGNGGDTITSYLVEWSKVSWDAYTPTVWELALRDSTLTGTNVEGEFRVSIDTSALPVESSVAANDDDGDDDRDDDDNNIYGRVHLTANIPASISPQELETLLENMPNVGDVAVTLVSPMTWRITFLSEVGNVDRIDIVSGHSIRDAGTDIVLGDVTVTQIAAGSIPLGAAYGSKLIANLDEQSSPLRYTIENLVPGQQYFVRVSSGNRLGLSSRRLTAPAALAPPVQKPGLPVSLFHEDSPPHLSVWSETSLLVQIGPPKYDGGAPLTYFVVEWDKAPTFDSASDGSALGSARTSVSSTAIVAGDGNTNPSSAPLCSSCVSSFDTETNTFTYSGDSTMQRRLLPQHRIMVYFSDDNTAYLFKIVSATTTQIEVDADHLRASSLESMNSRGGNVGATDLALLGAEYLIQGLDPNERYYVRVSAENGEMGTGLPQETLPASAIPRSAPPPPLSASLSVVDKHTLQVEWESNISSAGNTGSTGSSNHHTLVGVESYTVEYFTRSHEVGPTFSFFGTPEIIELDSSGLGLTGGWFHLYFGDEATSALPGTVEVAPGATFVATTQDLTPLLSRGDDVVINGLAYTVASVGPFTSSVLPLSEPFAGAQDGSATAFTRVKSSRLPHDVSADDLKITLENMDSVGQVEVRREDAGSAGNEDGYKWYITFLTNVGPQPSLLIDTEALLGSNDPAGFRSSKLVEGIAPDNFSQITISDPATTVVNITGLDTAVQYHVQVRANSNDRGSSLAMPTIPFAASPGQVPGTPLAPRVRPQNSETMLVTYEERAESNGAPISHYVIEAATSPTFENATIIEQALDHRIQRISSSAHSLPWDSTSSFTLSLGDFHGDYLSSIGNGATLVRIITHPGEGGVVAERIQGSDDLAATVPRGDYVRIGHREYRICLDVALGLPYDESSLPLCSSDDAWTLASAAVSSLADDASISTDHAPVFVLDTSLGSAKQPRLGDSNLNTINAAGSPDDVSNILTRGDLVRVGHPDDGETFRISTNPTRAFDAENVPLGTVQNAGIDASISVKSLKHSTYEVQSITIVAKESSHSLTSGSDVVSGFRLRFGSEITDTATAGGAKGCLQWDGDASDMKAELETLAGVDAVDVSRESIDYEADVTGAGFRYTITFVGDNVRGNVRPLQVIDVGENGCLDAAADEAGGKFSNDLEPIVIAQESISFVPLYRVQTTEEIPFDASAMDVQSAIENLSLTCKVEVERSMDGNGYSWDVTFASTRDEQEDGPHSDLFLLPMTINGENMEAHVDPSISIVGLQHVAVPSIASGIPHYVRIAAVNSFGMGPYVSSNPSSVEPSLQTPSASNHIYAQAISNTEVLVQWEAPTEDGGSPVTHYKVDYDTSSTFSSGINNGAMGSTTISSSDRRGISDVQFVTVQMSGGGSGSDSGGSPTKYLSGTFVLNFDGQTTRQLPHDATAEMVEDALEELCTVPVSADGRRSKVSVSRHLHCGDNQSQSCMNPEGYTWIVTFEDPGDRYYRYSSWLGSHRYSHQLKVDGTHLQECTDIQRTACVPSSLSGGNAMAYAASTPETQQIIIGTSNFTVSLAGQTSDAISVEGTRDELEEKLSGMPSVGHVVVECSTCALVGSGSNEIAPGDTVFITFLSMRGDVPLMTVSDPSASVSEVIKGSPQPVIGRSTYWTIIKGLSSVNRWNVRVQAYNAVGGGVIEAAQQNEIQTFVQSPMEPQEIIVTRGSDASSLLVSWDEPLSNGGASIDSFVVQYDTSPAFTSDGGQPIGQLIVGVDDTSVVRDILSTSEGSTTTRTTTEIAGLTPSVEYYVRVAAISSAGGLQGPFSGSITTSVTPIDVPGSVQSVDLTAIASTTLRVDWSEPLSSVPVESYVVEIALDEEGAESFSSIVATKTISESKVEVQTIELSASGDDANNDVGGFFTLSFDDASETVVIATNESAADLKTKLQSLSHVQGTVEVEREDSTIDEDNNIARRTWSVLFGDNHGDVPLLVANTDDLSPGTSLVISETTKGVGLPLHAIIDDLEEGQYYLARVAAFNSVGSGPWAQAPILRRARSVPDVPVTTAKILSNTETALTFTQPDSRGDDIDHYKVEWNSEIDGSFGTSKVVRIRINTS